MIVIWRRYDYILVTYGVDSFHTYVIRGIAIFNTHALLVIVDSTLVLSTHIAIYMPLNIMVALFAA